MSAIKSILVSVDLAEGSDRVLDYALDFASKLGARLTLLHVYNLPVYNFPDGSFVPTAEVAAQVGDAARRSLDATVARLTERGIEVTGLLRSGPTAPEICNVATEVGADLVIMGTHGRGALGRALLGSTANAVVRSSPVPVLTVRTTDHK
ncbi:MAG TPA: universal stress protein [Polyangiaceae bacterium]|jgi:nucleotide-binding universal stress UspA family protein|nr:universal stress protein [Polyangiaceae bacterium]